MEKLDYSVYEEIVKEAPASVIFCSKKGCHVCQGIHPLLDELEEEVQDKGINFYHLDVEEQPMLFQTLRGRGVPQILYYKYGEEAERMVGEYSYEEYADKLAEVF